MGVDLGEVNHSQLRLLITRKKTKSLLLHPHKTPLPIRKKRPHRPLLLQPPMHPTRIRLQQRDVVFY